MFQDEVWEGVICILDFGYYNMDCMDGMRKFPDKYFDLAIVDPPYGSGNIVIGGDTKTEKEADLVEYLTITKQKTMESFPSGKVERTGGGYAKKYGKKITHWDVAPTSDYFEELFRVSKNQIIWGGNYFSLPPTRCFLVWKKLTISDNFSMAMAEYAWTSFFDNAKVFEYAPQGNKEKRFHPTQKPVALYEWILTRYAKQGDKILDTHVGSASSLIAFHRHGFDYVGFELDKYYFDESTKRLEGEKNQQSIFDLGIERI